MKKNELNQLKKKRTMYAQAIHEANEIELGNDYLEEYGNIHEVYDYGFISKIIFAALVIAEQNPEKSRIINDAVSIVKDLSLKIEKIKTNVESKKRRFGEVLDIKVNDQLRKYSVEDQKNYTSTITAISDAVSIINSDLIGKKDKKEYLKTIDSYTTMMNDSGYSNNKFEENNYNTQLESINILGVEKSKELVKKFVSMEKNLEALEMLQKTK